MSAKKLTQREATIIKNALDERNPSIFTNVFLRAKTGGKLVYPGSTRYVQYLEQYKSNGESKEGFIVSSSEIKFKVTPQIDPETKKLLFYEDRGFVLLKWALEFYRAEQKEKTIIGLTGTGKTYNIGAIALFMAAAHNHFAFVNVAPTAKQSALMFKAIKEFIDGTEYRETFVLPGKQGIVESPWPRIRLYNGSSLSFFNIEKGGGNIQGEWGDWFNLDEGGLMNGVDGSGVPILDTLAISIVPRMRGERPDGKLRLGQYSITSMAYDCDPMWERYDKALTDPEHYWSKLVLHKDNYYLTPENIASIVRNAPPGLEGMWLRGERPPMLGTEFNPSILRYLYSLEQMAEARKNQDNSDPDKRTIILDSAFGVIHYEEPRVDGHIYLLAGDPGTDSPPNRNSPSIMVWDVTDFPRDKAKMVGFWWGFGDGSIMPFINKFSDLRRKYRVPENFRGFDSTSTQKYIAELAWMSEDETVIPLGFDGSKKFQYLNATKFLLSKNKLQIPDGIYPIQQQIKRYRLPDAKIVQDIVATFCMCCQLMYPLYVSEYGEIDTFGMERENQAGAMVAASGRHARQAIDRHARHSLR